MSRYLLGMAACGLLIAGCDRNNGQRVGTNANVDARGVDSDRTYGTSREVGPGRTDTSGARTESGGVVGQSANGNENRATADSAVAPRTGALGGGDAFMRDAASGNRMEVELGQVASRRSENARVKEFGQRMVDDHEQANQQLMSLARAQQVDVQAGMTEKHQKHVQHLSALQGREFDEAYMKMMVTDHQEVIRNYEEQSRTAQNAELRKYAEKTLPTLREHLRMAEEIQRELSSGTPREGGR